MPIVDIEPDIRKAKTLAFEFYTDERDFELSKERLFYRTWHFLGKANEVAGLKPVTILPDFLDEPVLLVRTAESLECLSNVCTHRGKILIDLHSVELEDEAVVESVRRGSAQGSFHTAVIRRLARRLQKFIMKIEIKLSDRLNGDMSQAAQNLKITNTRFVLSAIRRMANSNKASYKNIAASLNKFFSENPDLNKAWWELEENWDR